MSYKNNASYQNLRLGGNLLQNIYINDESKLILIKDGSNSLLTMFNNHFDNDYSHFSSFLFNFIDLFKQDYKLVLDCTSVTTNEYTQFVTGPYVITKLSFLEKFNATHQIPNDSIQIWTSSSPIENIEIAKEYLENGIKEEKLNNLIKLNERWSHILLDKPYNIGNLSNVYQKNTFEIQNKKYKVMALFNDAWSSVNLHSLIVSLLSLFESSEIIYNFNVAKTLIYDESTKIKDLNIEKAPIANILNIYNRQQLPNIYKESFVNLISPQFIEDSPLSYLSSHYIPDEIYKSILNFQPFIVVNKKYTLKRLRRIGFVTFNDWWDESYDSFEYHIDRTAAAISILNLISSKSMNEINQMYMSMKSVLIHNFNLAVKLQNEYKGFYSKSTYFNPTFNDYENYI
jgi:hypothetical protein